MGAPTKGNPPFILSTGSEAIAEAYKTVLDGILDLVAPKPSNENVSLAVKRVLNERNQWREVADHLYNCAIGDTSCAEWNKAYAEYESANAGAPTKGTPQLALMNPIPLNDAQLSLIKQWAADDRLWTTQETVQINLETFARCILKSV